MLKLGVLVSGGGTNLQAVIDRIEDGLIHAEIVGVVSSNPKAYALQRALQHNLEAVCIRKKDYSDDGAYEDRLIEYFTEKQAGLILTAGFNIILAPHFIKAFENKMMNVHPTLIPAFCGKGFYGLKVHEAVLASGVKLTGATVHFVNEIPDGGPIIMQKAIPVNDDDTPLSLQKKVMVECEQVIYPEAVRLFAENKLVVEGGKVRRIE